MIRIDLILVQKKIFEAKSKAQFAIKNNRVYCNGKLIKKCNYLVNDNDTFEIKGTLLPFVSKRGLKLEKAIKMFKVGLTDEKMIDIGSSTGVFSGCAIQNSILEIYVIDVESN